MVVKLTFKVVAVADVTVPTAPLLKVTVLRDAVVSNPKPLMVMVDALAPRFAELLVTTGVTVATCTAVPLLIPLVVTMAVTLPAAGLVENVTVNEVADAVVTVPTAPPLNATVLLAAVVLKPNPLMTKVFALEPKLAVLLVTTGLTVAICTAEPLLSEPVVTTAVKLPTAVGLVPNVTVSEVVEAEVTVPTAPLLKVTVLPEAVGLNPKPLIVMPDAFAARLAVLLVTTGVTVAT